MCDATDVRASSCNRFSTRARAHSMLWNVFGACFSRVGDRSTSSLSGRRTFVVVVVDAAPFECVSVLCTDARVCLLLTEVVHTPQTLLATSGTSFQRDHLGGGGASCGTFRTDGRAVSIFRSLVKVQSTANLRHSTIN